MAELTATILDSITLNQTDGDWEGRITLPSWAGYQARLGAYGGTSSSKPSGGDMNLTLNLRNGNPADKPSPLLVKSLKAFIDNQESIRNAMVAGIIEQVKQFREDEGAESAPNIKKASQLMKHAGPSILHVWAEDENSPAYVGMELGCDWEEEHGLGVLTHDGKVVGVGQADTAFSRPQPPDQTPALVKKHRAEYSKMLNDDKPTILTVSPAVTIQMLGEVAMVYEPHLRDDGTRIIGLSGFEAVVLGRFLKNKGVKVKSSRRTYDLAQFNAIFPDVNDFDAALKIVAASRMETALGRSHLSTWDAHWWADREICPINGLAVDELELVHSISQAYLRQADAKPHRKVTPKYASFKFDYQSYTLEVSPAVTGDSLQGLLELTIPAYGHLVRNEGKEIAGLAMAEAIIIREILLAKGLQVVSAPALTHHLPYIRTVYHKATEPVLIMKVLSNARRCIAKSRVIQSGGTPPNIVFVATMHNQYDLKTTISESIYAK